MRILLLASLPLLLSGCLAKTAFDVATLPVRAATAVVGAGIDAVTTTQAEADRARGRQLREEDERRGREAREAERRNRVEAHRLRRDEARAAERARRDARVAADRARRTNDPND